jgi:hypothetical protein
LIVIAMQDHLVVPIIGAQRPSVMKDDRLRIMGTPILVENLGALLNLDERHGGELPRFSQASGALACR